MSHFQISPLPPYPLTSEKLFFEKSSLKAMPPPDIRIASIGITPDMRFFLGTRKARGS